MFRSYAPSPIPGTVGPSHAPQNLPLKLNHEVGVGAFKERAIEGVVIAFNSPALTDEPLWVRVDEGP